MKKSILALVFLSAMTVPTVARAEFFTGNQLLRLMQSSQQSDRDVAMGYVMGVHDATRSIDHCAPLTLSSRPLYNQIREILERAPDVRDRTADVIIRAILSSAFPCIRS